MKIGLVRHFKVKHAYPSRMFVGHEELTKWFGHYDLADIEHQVVDLCGVTWDKCYSSPMPRALKTAESIFNGDIIKVDELQELNTLPLLNKRLKLPLILWAIIIRNKSLSSNLVTDEFTHKLKAFVDALLTEENKNLLICSHGFVMMFLYKELIKRGFKGDKFNTPVNGRIYLFEK